MAVGAASSSPKSSPKSSPSRSSASKSSGAKAKSSAPKANASKASSTAKATKAAEKTTVPASTVKEARKGAAIKENAAKTAVTQKAEVAKTAAAKKGIETATKTAVTETAAENKARDKAEVATKEVAQNEIKKDMANKSGVPKTANNLIGDANQSMRVHSNGAITVQRNSGTFGVEGSAYDVKWSPLKANGKIQTSMGVPSNERAPKGGHFIGQSTQTHNPPYNNPNGWIATVTPDGRPAVNANSSGVMYNVSGS